MAATTDRERTLKLARGERGVTPSELAKRGIHRQILTRLVAQGQIERVARGVYRLPEQPITENHALALAAAAVPQGIICLLSALRFHEIGTQNPFEVWVAIHRRAWRPTPAYPRLRIFRHTGEALSAGIETHQIEGWPVRIYGPAKTVVDCFKYRNKIGLDVALEALREGWRSRRFTMDELDRYAKVCRVQRVMLPYLEALLA